MKKAFILFLGIIFVSSMAYAEVSYKMRHNAQTGRGDWIVDASSVDTQIYSKSGWTDGGTRVYLTTSTDNVGIGTSTPAGKLQVFGGTTMGIGTTSPQTTLEVIGTAKATNIAINTTTPSGKVDIRNSGSEALFLLGSSSSAAGDYMVVTSAGNIGIGTTVPTAGLAIGAGTPGGTTGSTSAYIKDNLEVDGGIYVSGTAGRGTCISANQRLGVCSSAVAADGTCTCTAF